MKHAPSAAPCALALLLASPAMSQVDVAEPAAPQDEARTLVPEAERWPSWRGPSEQGVVPGKPPLEWSEDKNIKWKVETPGVGISTPIVWGKYLYFTTAIRTDEEGEAPKLEPVAGGGGAGRAGRGSGRFGGRRGSRGRRGRSTPLTHIHDFALVAMDRSNGKVAWQTTLRSVVPHERGHSTGSLASNSPITDGDFIYAHMGSRGLYCVGMHGDKKGKVQWKKDFGLMRTRNQFGEGSSPALHGNTIVINWDHEGESFVVALDKRSGEEIWRKKRDERTSWTTPRVFEVDGKSQLVVGGTTASRAYDLANGDVIWNISGMTGNVIPTPVYADGVCYLMSGFRGAALQAVRLAGAKGDLKESENLLWEHGAGTSYVPSACLYQGRIWFARGNTGRISCLDAKTGEAHYEGKSLAGIRQLYASPIAANGRVYFTSRDGLTVVIDAGSEYKELAANKVDDSVDASLVVIGDEIYMRGRKKIYCIAEIE